MAGPNGPATTNVESSQLRHGKSAASGDFSIHCQGSKKTVCPSEADKNNYKMCNKKPLLPGRRPIL